MKKILLGAVAAAAVLMPNVASADTNGHVAFSYNTLDDDNDSFKEDYLALGGAVAGSIGGSWNLQFDAEYGDMNHSGHTDNFTTVTAHLFSRNDAYAFGGFAGFTNDEIAGYVVGAEGAVYFGNFTLAGSALIGGDREDSDIEISNFGAAGTFFLNDNLSIGADANRYEFDFGGAGNSQDGTIYGLNAEYQFAGTGFSIFGGYHASDEDYFGTDKEANSVTIGGRYNFGTGSLLERDRSGASMLGASQMPRSQIFAW
jgi:hypothetical protein